MRYHLHRGVLIPDRRLYRAPVGRGLLPMGGRRFHSSGPNPDGLVVWYDSPQLVGLANNDPITTCTDFSGNGNNATQGTAASKPIYKTGVQNGLPVMRFDGVDDWMRCVFTSTLTQPTTVFVVFSSSGNNQYIADGADSFRMAVFTTASLSIYAGVQLSSSLATPISFSVVAATFDGINSSIYHNGTLVASGDAGASSVEGFTLGARFGISNFLAGDMGEFLVYNRTVSSAERQHNESVYLMPKWGLS
jgi:hypothetical protein